MHGPFAAPSAPGECSSLVIITISALALYFVLKIIHMWPKKGNGLPKKKRKINPHREGEDAELNQRNQTHANEFKSVCVCPGKTVTTNHTLGNGLWIWLKTHAYDVDVGMCMCIESMCVYLVSVRGVLVHVDYGPTYTTFFQVLVCNWICIVCSHTLRPHVHTHVHPDTAAHTLTQISSHVRTRLVAFALLDFHLCHHISRIALCTFWGQIVFLFQSPEWGSWFPVITPYILIFICQHSEGSSKKYEARSVSAEGSIPL